MNHYRLRMPKEIKMDFISFCLIGPIVDELSFITYEDTVEASFIANEDNYNSILDAFPQVEPI